MVRRVLQLSFLSFLLLNFSCKDKSNSTDDNFDVEAKSTDDGSWYISNTSRIDDSLDNYSVGDTLNNFFAVDSLGNFVNIVSRDFDWTNVDAVPGTVDYAKYNLNTREDITNFTNTVSAQVEGAKVLFNNNSINSNNIGFVVLENYDSKIEINEIEAEFSKYPHLSNLMTRTYIKDEDLSAYRQDLNLLLGTLVYVHKDYTKTGAMRFLKDGYKVKSKIPSNGLMESYTFTNKDNTSLGLFLKLQVSDEEVAQYTISDVSRAVLDTDYIDDTKVLTGYKSLSELAKNNNETLYLIKAITVTEIVSKKYKKKGNKITVSNLPAPASAFAFDKSLYTSSSKFRREYQIGLNIVELERIIAEKNLTGK